MIAIALRRVVAVCVMVCVVFVLNERSGVAMEKNADKPESFHSAVFAGGCFWCLESEFRRLSGVLFTEVGYSGGTTEDPTYEQVSTGRTGHAEVVRVSYDPDITDFKKLTTFFLEEAHDPTQKDRQGVDVGTQYRSIIFYADDEEKAIAESEIARVDAEKRYPTPIMTLVQPLAPFWMAEEYHQQYYEKYETKTGEKHIRVKVKEAKKAAQGLGK